MRTFLLSTTLMMLVGIVSCKKKEQTVPAPTAKSDIKLMRLHHPGKSFSHTLYFQYDNDGYISKIVKWDSSLVNNPGPADANRYDITYEYGANHLVSKETVSIANSSELAMTGIYAYNDQKHLQQVDYYYRASPVVNESAKYEWKGNKIANISFGTSFKLSCYYNASGNLSGMSYTFNQKNPVYKDLSFDKMHNFLAAIKGLDHAYGLFDVEPYLFCVNNAVAYTTTDGGDSKSYKYVYTYNTYGFPVTQADSSGNVITTFQYDK